MRTQTIERSRYNFRFGQTLRAPDPRGSPPWSPRSPAQARDVKRWEQERNPSTDSPTGTRRPTQVAASANRGESAANRKDCSLSHTSPAPRVLGRPSRDLRTGVERRLRPSARFSRGRALLAAFDASHVPMEACGAPVSTDWTVSAGGRNRSEAKRFQETGERGDQQAGDCMIGTSGALSA